jgi:WD40 repeat protein
VVRAVALGDGGDLASSAADGTVALWQAQGEVRFLEQPPTDAASLTFSRTGDVLLGSGWFNIFRWDTNSGSLRVLKTEHRGRIPRIGLTSDGQRLATISEWSDSTVLLLDPKTGATLERLEPHALCGAAVAVSGDGAVVASTSDDGSVRIWELNGTPQPIAPR